jgi:hypothetical protein
VPGTFSPGGASVLACNACVVGRYATSVGQAMCTACAAGKFGVGSPGQVRHEHGLSLIRMVWVQGVQCSDHHHVLAMNRRLRRPLHVSAVARGSSIPPLEPQAAPCALLGSSVVR